jgi:hypothetical protein
MVFANESLYIHSSPTHLLSVHVADQGLLVGDIFLAHAASLRQAFYFARRKFSGVSSQLLTHVSGLDLLQGNLLYGRSHFHLLLSWLLFFQRAVETSATDRNQLAQALDTQAALQKHYFADLLVDAVSPESPRFWRRASIFCKAPLKKSTSMVFSASNRFSC